MANKKPSKVVIYLDVLAALAAAVAAAAYFLSSRNLLGWIWIGTTLIWCVSTFFAARTYHWRMLSYRRIEQVHADFARRGWSVRDVE